MNKVKPVCRIAKAFAPATVANVGCGFDIMGFAIEGIGDEVEIELLESNAESIVIMKGPYGQLIPSDWAMNTASVAAQAYLNYVGQSDIKCKLTLYKNLPLGSGMGSSAASSVAAIKAMNQIFNHFLTDVECLSFVMEAERIACGTAHADNVAPSLLGGFVLVQSYQPLHVCQVNFSSTWYVVVCHPNTILRTSDSRSVVPQQVSLRRAIQQSANSAGLILALINQDKALMQQCVHDELAEPKRRTLIPNFFQIEKSILAADGFNCNISGSGPSIFSFCETLPQAEIISSIMQSGFLEVGLQSETYISPLLAKGAHVISYE